MRYSISSWSLHGLITAGLPLLELPGQIVAHGIGTLELCHFHLPTVDTTYLGEFRSALADADVELYSLLIDTGDITAPNADERASDLQTIKRNIEIAAALGAKKVRVDAGRQEPTAEVVALSAAGLTEVTDFADGLGVAVITENWHATSLQPLPLLAILGRCDGRVGLCADSGNAEGPDKYGTLELLFPKATSVHFKARYAADQESVEAADVARVFGIAKDAGFSGPVSLIYGGTEGEWAAIDRLKAAIGEFF